MFKQIPGRFHNSKLKFTLLLLFALPLVITSSACRTVVSGLVTQPNFLEEDEANAAADAVKAKFGNSVKVLDVQISENTFEAKIQDPDNPKNVDLYKYTHGLLLKTGAVQLNGLERNLEKTLFDFSEIDFSAVSRLSGEIQNRARLENGEIQKIEIRRGLNLSADFENSGSIRWSIVFANERESVTATADAKGKLRGVDLSQTSQALTFNLLEPQEITRAAESLREAFGAKALINEISISDKYMGIKKADPNDPELILQYKYTVNGLMKDSMPPMTKSVVDEYFSLDEVNFEDVPRLMQIALEKLPAPQAHISNISVEKVRQMKDDTYLTRWEVSVKPTPGLGGKIGFVRFDAKGNLIEVLKWK